MAATLLLYFGAAILGALLPNGSDRTADGAIEVLLLRGPIHVDLVLPLTPDTRKTLAFLDTSRLPLDHPDARGLVVGWGAHEFYTTTGQFGDMAFGPIWRAATGDSAVLRFDVTGTVRTDRVARLALTQAQFARLLSHIRNSIPEPSPIANAGLTATDVFYPVDGRFHLFQTCNVWIAQALAASDVQFGRWTPMPFAVRLSAWWHQPDAPRT